jgi:hypothetical protein
LTEQIRSEKRTRASDLLNAFSSSEEEEEEEKDDETEVNAN